MMPSFAATRFTYDIRLRIRIGNDEVPHDQGIHFASNERTVGVCRGRYNWFTLKIERRIQYHRNTGKIGKTLCRCGRTRYRRQTHWLLVDRGIQPRLSVRSPQPDRRIYLYVQTSRLDTGEGVCRVRDFPESLPKLGCSRACSRRPSGTPKTLKAVQRRPNLGAFRIPIPSPYVGRTVCISPDARCHRAYTGQRCLRR